MYDNCNVNIDKNDILQVVESMTGNSISGKGPYVEEFENKLKSYFGSKYVLTCSSGTSAILMVLMSENVQSGDEVLLPPTAPIMTVLPILHLGAKPVFVDTELNNFNVNLKDLQSKFSQKSKMFINVPMWGYANNVDEVVKICHANGVKVMEDNSHCHGTRLSSSLLGTFGDYSIFSTHERKLISTGEGGFIISQTFENYDKLKEIRSFGEIVRDNGNLTKGQYGLKFGLNFKLSSINAALGISQLSKLPGKILARKENANTLRNLLSSYSNQFKELDHHKDSDSNYYSIVFVCEHEFRNKIEEHLKSNGIISDPLRYKYCPLYKFKILEDFSSDCKNAENLINSVFTLPVHEGLSQSDFTKMNNIIKTLK